MAVFLMVVVLLVSSIILFSGTKSSQPNDEKPSQAETALEPVVAAISKSETVPQIPLLKCKTGWLSGEEFFKDCVREPTPTSDSKAKIQWTNARTGALMEEPTPTSDSKAKIRAEQKSGELKPSELKEALRDGIPIDEYRRRKKAAELCRIGGTTDKRERMEGTCYLKALGYVPQSRTP